MPDPIDDVARVQAEITAEQQAWAKALPSPKNRRGQGKRRPTAPKEMKKRNSVPYILITIIALAVLGAALLIKMTSSPSYTLESVRELVEIDGNTVLFPVVNDGSHSLRFSLHLSDVPENEVQDGGNIRMFWRCIVSLTRPGSDWRIENTYYNGTEMPFSEWFASGDGSRYLANGNQVTQETISIGRGPKFFHPVGGTIRLVGPNLLYDLEVPPSYLTAIDDYITHVLGVDSL